MAASLLLSPLFVSTIENRELGAGIGLQKSSFLYNTKLIDAPSSSPNTRTTTVRRQCFRSPRSEKSLDHIPKQFRGENLKDGLMDNYKNAPQYLYGLSPSQLNMFVKEDNPAQRQSEKVKLESISSAYSYANHGPMSSLLGMDEHSESRYGMRGGMHRGRRPSPPDLPSLILDSRVVYIGMPLVPEVTELILSQLLYLDYESKTKPIHVYINSSGTQSDDKELLASDTEAYAIADMMAFVKPDVYTLNMSMAYGQAAMLLSLGKKGRRFVRPNAFTRLYLPKTYKSSGCSTDMWIKAKDLEVCTEYLLEYLSYGIGKSRGELNKDLQVGKSLSPEEAIEYGIVDEIMSSLYGNEQPMRHDKTIAEAKAMRRAAVTPGADPSGYW